MTSTFISITLILLICHYSSIVEADLPPYERDALITLLNAVGRRSLLWNLSNSPCTWKGVLCSKAQDTVMRLRLPGVGLSGQLPVGLGNLTNLQTLSLRINALSGSIPSDIIKLNGSLRNLYLQENFFSGEIPEFLFSMQNLVRLNLAHNNFSGEIRKDFGKLTRLRALYLEENQLTGSIPELKTLSGITTFNVSYNRLGGRIPSWVAGMPESAFQGNSLCGEPLVACKKKKKLSAGAIAGIVIGCVVGVLLIIMCLILMCARSRGDKKDKSEYVDEKNTRKVEISREKAGATAGGGGSVSSLATVARREDKSGANSLVFFGNVPRKFDLEDLLRASAEVLGKGTFGTTYKATLDAVIVVAVKRLKDVVLPEKELREKMEAVGRMNHENLVPLRAYFYSRDEKLLVYDYMSMGSLSALLHGNRGAGRTPLNWETRSGIALGAARGIAYIHSQGPASSHGNIKSSNILLTTSYEARVSDFGLAHLAVPAPTPNRIDGYRAPEVTDHQKVSQKADVYSFGVLLLELLTGKPPAHSLNNDEGLDLPRWVQSIVREEWTVEVFDLDLLRYQTVEEEMVQLLQLAVDCTAQYPDSRPTMAEVKTLMEEICRPSMQEEQAGDNDHDIIDEKASQHTYSNDSSAPP